MLNKPKLLFLSLVFLLINPTLLFAENSLNVRLNEVSFSFVKIPSGEFIMGNEQGQSDEIPLRKVKVDSFYLQTTETTREQFQIASALAKALDQSGCGYFETEWEFDSKLSWRNPGYRQQKDHPVVCISWNDAQEYIQHLNRLSQSYRFRLPTESEWEYAARAGSKQLYYWGSNPTLLCTHANASDLNTLERYPSFKSNRCDDGYLATAPVANYIHNPYGLFDIYGNVWEWTQDCWNHSYQNAPSTSAAWLKGDCERRVFRGGGWGDNPKFANSTLRNRGPMDTRKDDIGFRLVVERIIDKAL